MTREFVLVLTTFCRQMFVYGDGEGQEEDFDEGGTLESDLDEGDCRGGVVPIKCETICAKEKKREATGVGK